MKLPIKCMKCLQEFGKPSEDFSHVEIRNDSRYEFTCSNGHKTVTILQQQKFEILFEIGLHAILDGYYREAVSSFSSSLERFYEFAIRAILEKTTESEELFQNCWKEVSRISERQLGAFIFLWASYFDEKPSILPHTKVEFRNEIIHQGKIPTRDEAINFGTVVIEVLSPKMHQLQQKLPDMIKKSVFRHMQTSRLESDDWNLISSLGYRTLLNIGLGDPMPEPMPLEQYLESLAKMRRAFGLA